MRLFPTLLCLFILAAAPALAEEANSGFGAPFAAVEHPGFSDPVDSASDAAAAAAIEPAAGDAETAIITDDAAAVIEPSFEEEAAPAGEMPAAE